MTNEPKKIIVHCTATPAGRDVSAADIDRWHRDRGWNGIGYHSVIKLDGTVELGRREHQVGAHVRGQNVNSLGIAYVGGMDKDNKHPEDTRTLAQREALLRRIATWCKKYNISFGDVYGHYEFDSHKACPSFDMTEFRAELGKYTIAANKVEREHVPTKYNIVDPYTDKVIGEVVLHV